jgi:Flp pilus assembly protein TadD
MNRDVVFILLLGGVYIGIMLAWKRFRIHQIKQWWTAGHAALAGDDAGAAVAAFRKCLRIWPAAPNFHEALGTALSRLGRLEEAERELRLAADLEPSRAQSQLNLALFYAFAVPGRDCDAVAAFERVRELDPALAKQALAQAHIAARLEEAAGRCGTAVPGAAS